MSNPVHPFDQAVPPRPEFHTQAAAPRQYAPSMGWRNLLGSIVAFTLGLVFQFNPLSATWHIPFLRLSDAVLFIAILGLIPVLSLRQLLASAWVVGVMFVLTALTVRLKTEPGEGDTYFSLIIFASVVAAYMWSAAISRDERFAIHFSYGWLIGFVLAVVVLFLRAKGLDLTPYGLGVPVKPLSLSAILAIVKPGGLWVHGNEAGHVFALAGAPALYLALRFRRPTIYLVYYAVFLASFTITLNRGGVIAPTIGLVIAYLAAGRGALLVKIILFFCGMVAIAGGLYFLPMFETMRTTLELRFLADSNLQNNAGDRYASMWAGIQTAFGHPFGIGTQARMTEMEQLAHGLNTPHNGYIALAFQTGLAPVFIYAVSLVRLLRKPSNRFTLVGLMAAYAVPSMFFEELTINPIFLFVIALTIAAAWLPPARPWVQPRPVLG